MREFREVFAMVTDRIEADPPDAWRKLERRRRRSTRNQKLGAFVLVGALVAAVILGVQTLRSDRSRPAGHDTAPPVPSATPLPNEASGHLPPGTYVFGPDSLPGAESVRITFSLPRGWDAFDVGVLYGNGPHHMGLTFNNIEDVYANPCRWIARGLVSPGVGPSVDDLATALANQPLRDATAPTEVTLDGFEGKYLVQSVPRHIRFSRCDDGEFMSWEGAGGGYREEQGPGERDQLWILDVHGNRLVIDAFYMPGTSPQERAQLQRMVESIRIAG